LVVVNKGLEKNQKYLLKGNGAIFYQKSSFPKDQGSIGQDHPAVKKQIAANQIFGKSRETENKKVGHLDG